MKPENYQSIFILLPLSKVVEKAMVSRLDQIFTSNGLYAQERYGYMKGKSTELALLYIVEKTKQNIESKSPTMGVFIDLTMAFGVINHKVLLTKLEEYGIRETPLELIKNSLLNHEQYLHVNGAS